MSEIGATLGHKRLGVLGGGQVIDRGKLCSSEKFIINRTSLFSTFSWEG